MLIHLIPNAVLSQYIRSVLGDLPIARLQLIVDQLRIKIKKSHSIVSFALSFYLLIAYMWNKFCRLSSLKKNANTKNSFLLMPKVDLALQKLVIFIHSSYFK